MTNSFLISPQNADKTAKDVAAHILARVVTARELKNMEGEMKQFLVFLLDAQGEQVEDRRPITALGFSAALMHLLKVNDILQYFVVSNGMQTYCNTILSP